MILLIVPIVVVLIADALKFIPDPGADGSPWIGLVLLFSFFAAWLAWAIQVPKWRLWSYQRVDNVQALKAQAIAARLVWPDSSLFTRTEIASRETWSRIRELEAANGSR